MQSLPLGGGRTAGWEGAEVATAEVTSNASPSYRKSREKREKTKKEVWQQETEKKDTG